MSDSSIMLHYNIIDGDYIRGGEASSNIKKALMQLGVDSNRVKKVCIACYEAEMNIVIHSLGGFIDAVIYKDRIEIKAEDKGPGIADIDLAMKEGYSTASEEAREMGFGGGMGLPNIKRSCDNFKITSSEGNPTIVEMTILF